MGMIADNMNEVIERSQRDAAGVLLDLRVANTIEFIADATGAWVNIDGTCVLRVASVTSVLVDTSARPEAEVQHELPLEDRE